MPACLSGSSLTLPKMWDSQNWWPGTGKEALEHFYTTLIIFALQREIITHFTIQSFVLNIHRRENRFRQYRASVLYILYQWNCICTMYVYYYYNVSYLVNIEHINHTLIISYIRYRTPYREIVIISPISYKVILTLST